MSEWYYMYGGQQQGPVRGSQLKALAASGGLGPDDLVWNTSMADWAPASKVRGLVFPGHHPIQQPAAPAPVQSWAPAYAQPEAPQSYAPEPATAPAENAPIPEQAAQGLALNYSQPTSEEVSARTIDLLRRTRPWVLLISVFMFIMVGILALVGVLGFVAMLAGSAAASRFSGGPAPAMAGAVSGIVMMIFMLAYAALLFFPAMFLMRYASAINRLAFNHRVKDLEEAMQAQKSYWMFMGILLLIGISFYALSLLLLLVGVAMH